jgi:gas vesicle protein
MDAMQKFVNFIAGITVGALVGAAAALLMTPTSGNDVRENIQNRADGLMSELKSAVADERRRLEAELEALKRGELQVE